MFKKLSRLNARLAFEVEIDICIFHGERMGNHELLKTAISFPGHKL
jgi:hypothetical protein